MIHSGKLRHRVRLEDYVAVLDEDGNVVQDEDTGQVQMRWELVANLWASIEPLSGREFIAAQSTQSEVRGRIVIRYRAGVSATMRIVHKGLQYAIFGVLSDKDSGLEYLTLPVGQGVIVEESEVSAPSNLELPYISPSSPIQGQTIYLNDGVWDGAVSYTRQLRRNGVAIAGATGTTYVPTADDVGQQLTLVVVASNLNGVQSTAVSLPTANVLAADASAVPYPLTVFVVSGYANLTRSYSLLPAIGGGSGVKTIVLNGTPPAGLAIADATTGELTGTPTSLGTVSGLTYSVTDDTGTVTSEPFSIIVGAAPVSIAASGDTTGTTDSAAIEAALAAGSSISLAAGVRIKSPITLRSNQAVYLAAGNTALFLVAGSNCMMFRNADRGSQTRVNQNISIVGDGTSKLDGNGINQATPVGNPQHVGFFMVSVQNMQIRGVITAPKNQNVIFIGCKNMAVQNVQFAATGGNNNDGLDCGPGCVNVHAEVIRGVVGDDTFSYFAKKAQTGGNFSSGTPWENGADCTNFICNDVQIASSAQNVIRLQADANFKLTNFYARDIYNTQTANANIMLQLGEASYIDQVPTTTEQLHTICVERFGGSRIALEAGLLARDVFLKSMYASVAIESAVRLTAKVNNVTLDGVLHSAVTTVTHGSLFTSSSLSLQGLTIRNVLLPNLTSILAGTTGGNVTLRNIRISAGASFFPTTGTWTGTMREVSVLDSQVSSFSGVSITGSAPTATDAATTAYAAARTVAMSTARRWNVNQLLVGLREDGFLTRLDRLMLFCDEAGLTDATINVMNPAGTKASVLGGSSTFVANSGIGLNGTTEYIQVGTTWQAEGKFSLNSALMGVWVNAGNSGTGGIPLLGVESGTPNVRLFGRNGGGAASWRLNGAADNAGPAMTTRLRHHTISRVDAAMTRRYFNGLMNNLRSEPASALPSGPATVGRNLTAYSPDRFALMYSGSGLTEREAMRLHARLATFTAAVGAQ